MKLRTLILTTLIVMSAGIAGAQRMTTFTATQLTDLAGNPANGKLCMQPTLTSGAPIGFAFSGGGQGTQRQVCFPVTNGVLASGTQVPNTSTTNPQNICLLTQLIISNAQPPNNVAQTWPCLQPSGSTWSLDTYAPTTPALPFLTGPAGPAGPAGPTGPTGPAASIADSTVGAIAVYSSINGVAGGIPDTDSFLDPASAIENGGVLYAQNGIVCHGDSNGAGFGLSSGNISWCGQIFSQTNNGALVSVGTGYYGSDEYQLAGDAVGDFTNRALMMDAPQDNNNPVYFSGYSTNNYICCSGGTAPTTAQQQSFQSQYAAALAWDATSNATDKFMPTSQVATATSYVIQGNAATSASNTAIVQAANNYIPYQWVVLGSNGTTGTNFTTSPMSGLNGTPVQILPTNLSPAEYSFSTTKAVTTSTADTGTATPTNVMSQTSGTWSLSDPILDYGFNAGGGFNQGIGYQVGNLITIPCSISNTVLNVVSVTTVSVSGLTLNITASSGVITAITLGAGGTGVVSVPQYGLITGGGGTGAFFSITAMSGGAATAVTLLAGGTGYSTTSLAATSFTGQTNNASFTVNTLGAGCTPAVVATATTCSVGSGTSCGFGLSINTAVGPAMYTTSGGGTISTPPTSGSNAIYVPKGGDVLVIYPAGPLFGGAFQFFADGVALTDSYTGSSTITQSYATNVGPRNFPTKLVFQLAHYKVMTGYHQFAYTCASGNQCGVMSIIVPTEHNAGTNAPNITVAGAIPEQNNIQASCGLTLPKSCTSLFSTLIQSVVGDLSGAGLRVKYADNQNIDAVLDFVDNGGSTPPLIQNRIPNTTNALHMAPSGHVKFANNMLWAAKVIPAVPTSLKLTMLDASAACNTSPSCWPKFGNAPAGTQVGPGVLLGVNLTGSIGRYDGVFSAPQSSVTAIGTSSTGSANIFFGPSGDAQIRTCNYTAAGGFTSGVPNIFGWTNPNQLVCFFEFTDSQFNLLSKCTAVSGTNCSSGLMQFNESSWNTAAGTSRIQFSGGFSGTGAASALGLTTSFIANTQAPGTPFWNWLNGANGNGGLQWLINAPSGAILVIDQSGVVNGKTAYFQGSTGSIALDLLFNAAPKGNAPTGVVTFSAATGASAPTCVSTTCTNKRGKISIVATTATTGTIGTVNFSASLSAAPFCSVNEVGDTTWHGIDNGTPTTASFTVTAANSVASSTISVDYNCTP